MEKTIGVVFPGYGEQYISMGKDLYEEHRIIQEFFEQASGCVDINFVKVVFASSEADINSPLNAYLSIFLFECSLYEILRQKGLQPDFVSGYGVGEYAACFASESLSFIDGMYFINKYAHLYEKFLSDKDFSVLRIPKGFTKEEMETLCEKSSFKIAKAYVAAQNTEDSYYISGSKNVLEKVAKECDKRGIKKVKDIGVEYGLHSPEMNEVVDQLKPYYHKIKFKDLKYPVITNVDAAYVTTAEALQGAVMRRINNPILWYEVMQGYAGCDVIISVGPGSILIDWMKKIYPDKEYYTVSNLKDMEKLTEFFEEEKEESGKVFLDDEGIEQKKTLLDADLVNEKESDFDIDDEE